jgi:2-pyrone-4,6-dicarboxylate lactonase
VPAPDPRRWRVGLVGYGEVGRIIAEDLRTQGLHVSACDIKLNTPAAPPLKEHAKAIGVRLTSSHSKLAAHADLVISAVTASQTWNAARACGDALRKGAWFLDVNSASPGTKRRAARLIEARGAHYVDAAIMTSVPPHRIRVPMLLCGPGAELLTPLINSLGFDARPVGGQPGHASAAKMCRSVIVKGLETLVVESFTSARHHGVESDVLASLAETFPGIDWEKQGAYFFQRTIAHGRRRAEEMREVAQAVREAGLEPWAALASAQRQDWMADLAGQGVFGPRDDRESARSADWRVEADRILARTAPPATFTKSPGWLDWFPNPSKPQFRVPPGSVDAHCHVFGPGAIFPYAPERKYTPCDAGREELFRLRDHLGFARNVIVQATCHGADNRAMVDVLLHSGGRARGVATVRRDVTDAELVRLHEAGVRGVRFNFLRRLVDFTPREELQEIAGRVAKLGWHVVVYFEAADLPELQNFFVALPTIVVVDHMGRPDVTKPVDGPEFERFVKFMRDNPHVWSKVGCPERLSVSGPPALNGERNAYRDVVPFGRRIVERFPDRVLWGTDWPHPNLKGHMPDDGLLVDFIPHIAPTPELQRKLLVDNPMRLYWPGEN